MNYTLMAYAICLILALAILAQPQTMMITLREESLEKTSALDYWLVVNALAYAYDKPNPEEAFTSFLSNELQALDPRIVEVPSVTIEVLTIKQNHLEAIVSFNHTWGVHKVRILLRAIIIEKSSSYDPQRNLVIVKAKLQILSDKPILISFKALTGELLSVRGYADQVYEVEVGIPPNAQARLLIMDSRGLRLMVVL